MKAMSSGQLGDIEVESLIPGSIGVVTGLQLLKPKVSRRFKMYWC
jgi:hypothetical protein